MTVRPLVSVLVIGAIFSASLGSAHGQDAASAAPPEPQAAPAPAPGQYPPPGYPPPGYAPYPPGAPMYAPQGPAAWPRYIKDWEEGQPVPYGYHPETRARKGLVIPGAVMLGVAYLLSTLVASANDSSYNGETYNALWIPVIGPFIELGTGTTRSGDNEAFLLDGLAQAAGLTMLVMGLAFPRTILVRNDMGTISFIPKPMLLGHDGGGLGLVGRF